MAPVVRELERHGQHIESWICVTGQPRDMLDQVLDLFHIGTDYDLDVMRPGQSPAQVAAKVMGCTRADPESRAAGLGAGSRRHHEGPPL